MYWLCYIGRYIDLPMFKKVLIDTNLKALSLIKLIMLIYCFYYVNLE
jgi:hypothetical protein